MKKLISFLLVIMMLCSMSVSAFADVTESIDVRVNDAKYNIDAATLDTPKTEVWIQVAADGQIDVTVPLVLVFKTDIDGGHAQTADPDKYTLTNNGTADLSVIKVKAENKTSDVSMNLVGYEDNISVTDNYGVKLSNTANKFEFDVSTNDGVKETSALDGGLITLPKSVTNNGTKTTTPVEVKVDMTTGPLSFVTGHKVENNTQVVDDTKGALIMTVTYTVAIKTSGDSVKGDTITTAQSST